MSASSGKSGTSGNPGNSNEIARRVLTMDGEILHRDEKAGPFVAALVELTDGGYMIRVAQPRVVDLGRSTNPMLPMISEIGPYGPANYSPASVRFNKLVDKDLQ